MSRYLFSMFNVIVNVKQIKEKKSNTEIERSCYFTDLMKG